MENYHILERIGEGSFGKVYRGRRKYTGQIVALKFVSKRGKTPKDLQNLREEINILRRLNHCNIIAILDSFETDGEFCMVTEYAQGELFQVLTDDQQLPESEIRLITIQLLQALQVLHRQRIIHRDMKPQNILIGSKQQIKLADFGFARAISHESSVLHSIKGTPLYMAPELVQEQPYNCTVDLWSLGVILYELAVGTPPFYTDKIVTLVQMIVREPVRFPVTMSPQFKSFLNGLLTKDPRQRLGWPAILHHPFVVETSEERQRRMQLEDEFRQLPRFFQSETHQAVDAQEQVRPSVERLRQSVEWKPCDPETGRRVETTPPPPVAKPNPPPPPPTQQSPPPVESTDPETVFVSAHATWTEAVRGKSGADVVTSVAWTKFFHAMLSAPPSSCSASMIAALTTLQKALAAILHQCIAPDPAVMEGILSTRTLLHSFLHLDYLHQSPVEGVLLQCVRVCTNFTAIVNALVEDDSRGGGSSVYRQCCGSDLRLLAALLQSATPNVAIRALKWLGGMLANAQKLTPLLEEVPSSGVVAALCDRLAVWGSLRSPGGTASSTQSLFAVFALAAFVQPEGRKWGPLPTFPVMTLVQEDQENKAADIMDEEIIYRLYKLRVKIHGEVTAQLLRRGLPELLALVHDELQSPSKEEDEEEEPDQTTVACVLKILVHACRSSSPLAKKLTASRVRNHDVVALTLALLSPSHPLRPYERSVAVELLVILLRRQVLTKHQVWNCCVTLHQGLLRASDAAVLSHLCSFFSDVLENNAVDANEQNTFREEEHYDVLELVLHGVLSVDTAKAVWRLLAHDHFASIPSRSRRATLQTIACYNVRAQGLVDAGVVLLLRVAARALSAGGDPSALGAFEELFTSPSTWPPLQRLLERGGDDLLSPWGLFCLLKLLRMVRELPSAEPHVNSSIVPALVALLDVRHVAKLLRWPEVVGGGANAVKALVHAIVKVLGIPFVQPTQQYTSELAAAQETLYDAQCVLRLLAVLQAIGSGATDAAVLELPMSFLSRLVTSSEHFGAQFVAADGVAVVHTCGMLRTAAGSASLAIDTLLIVSQLARSSEDHYACVLDAGLVPELRDLVRHREPMVRAKALNCVGNLCRHSTQFYDAFAAAIHTGNVEIDGSSVFVGVVHGLTDADGYVRRFACFAIGNAAFHTAQLYRTLRGAVPALIENLHDADEKTRSNAAGALGNLVRNSDELCGDMCKHHAPSELWGLARSDPSVASRRIVLFSLGNFCVHAACVHAVMERDPDFVSQLERLYEDASTDDVARKNIRRILAKLGAQL